jgi:hypothetical protein
MSPRTRSLALALLALVAVTTGAAAQEMRMSTVVDNMVGEAGDTPEARLVFVQQEDDLCVVIAIVSGPTALRAPLFRFARRGEGGAKAEQLEFALPKKPERTEQNGERLMVWEGCLKEPLEPAPAPGKLEVSYFDKRLLGKPVEYVLAFPELEAPQGLDVTKDSAGNLLLRSFQPEADPIPQ